MQLFWLPGKHMLGDLTVSAEHFRWVKSSLMHACVLWFNTVYILHWVIFRLWYRTESSQCWALVYSSPSLPAFSWQGSRNGNCDKLVKRRGAISPPPASKGPSVLSHQHAGEAKNCSRLIQWAKGNQGKSLYKNYYNNKFSSFIYCKDKTVEQVTVKKNPVSKFITRIEHGYIQEMHITY